MPDQTGQSDINDTAEDCAELNGKKRAARNEKRETRSEMKARTMEELVAEHRDELAALTQRIGEQNAVINQRDAAAKADVELLKAAAYQISALSSALNDILGIERTSNVVALMIDDRLKDRE